MTTNRIDERRLARIILIKSFSRKSAKKGKIEGVQFKFVKFYNSSSVLKAEAKKEAPFHIHFLTFYQRGVKSERVLKSTESS